MTNEKITYRVIQIASDDSFKILNLSSWCAYGSYETRDEAEQAIKERDAAHGAHAFDPMHY